MIVYGYKNRASGANVDAGSEGVNSSKEVHSVLQRVLASLDYKEDVGTGATQTNQASRLRSCGT